MAEPQHERHGGKAWPDAAVCGRAVERGRELVDELQSERGWQDVVLRDDPSHRIVQHHGVYFCVRQPIHVARAMVVQCPKDVWHRDGGYSVVRHREFVRGRKEYMVINVNNLQYFYTVFQTLVFADRLHSSTGGTRWFRARIRYRAPPRKTQGHDDDRTQRSIRAVARVQSMAIDTNNGLGNGSSILRRARRRFQTDRRQRRRRVGCIYSCTSSRCCGCKRV